MTVYCKNGHKKFFRFYFLQRTLSTVRSLAQCATRGFMQYCNHIVFPTWACIIHINNNIIRGYELVSAPEDVSYTCIDYNFLPVRLYMKYI